MANRIFIDCGAHKGQSIKYFPECEIHCFEPNPIFWPILEKLPVILHKQAVWTKNGKLDFYLAKYSEGSTLVKNKNTAKVDYKNPIEVEAIDLAEFIDNLEGYLILKLNVEGAEYDILDHLLKRSIKKISELYVEFHTGKVDYYDEKDLVYRLFQSGIKIQKWPLM